MRKQAFSTQHHPARRATDYGEAIGAHREAIQTLKDEVHEMRKDMKDIKDLLANTKGAWRMLVLVGTVGGAVAGFIIGLFQLLKHP